MTPAVLPRRDDADTREDQTGRPNDTTHHHRSETAGSKDDCHEEDALTDQAGRGARLGGVLDASRHSGSQSEPIIFPTDRIMSRIRVASRTPSTPASISRSEMAR